MEPLLHEFLSWIGATQQAEALVFVENCIGSDEDAELLFTDIVDSVGKVSPPLVGKSLCRERVSLLAALPKSIIQLKPFQWSLIGWDCL